MEKEIELEQEAIVVYSGGGAVNSVNGYTGDVVLTTSDLENTSDYQTGTEVESAISTAIAGKQDTLTAGNNITISNNTISATDTTYSAGTGLTLSGTQFSVNTNTIATQQDVTDEATARQNADINLQGQIDAISSASDVTDIVGTYADLQAYDTQHLKNNDIIKVLQDESQNDETTYYRWSTTTHTFTLIGEEGPYYTKSATDILLQGKQDVLTAGSNITIASDNTISATDTTYTAGTNVSISSGNVISATDTTYTAGTGLSLNGTEFSADTSVLATQTDLSGKQNTLTAGSNITISGDTISATDTTYSAFTGTDGTAAGTAGLVPAPATTDAGKFLKADGTWDTAGGGSSYTAGDGIDITNAVISATNTGKAKVLTSADYNWNSTLGSATEPYNSIGLGLLDYGIYSVAKNTQVSIYPSANFPTYDTLSYIIIGDNPAGVASSRRVLFNRDDKEYIGSCDFVTSKSASYYYLLDQYSLTNSLTSTSTTTALTANQGKTLKDLVDGLAISGAGAPTTSTVGTVGKLYEDTTNGKLYICTAVSGSTYTWTEVGAGGSGPTVVQTTGTSTTDVMSQNAVTSMVFADPSTKNKVQIGKNASASAGKTVAILGTASANSSIAIGDSSLAAGLDSLSFGNSTASSASSVAFPYGVASTKGIFQIGTNSGSGVSKGYNDTQYRLLTGLYDPQSAHDAATKGYVDPTTDSSAPTTATVGRLGQIQIDTTTATAYMCVAVDTVTPAYTWKQITA